MADQDVSTLLDRLIAEAQREEPSPTEAPSAPTSAAASASADASPLGALFSNPALMTALPTLMRELGPMLSGLGGKGDGGGGLASLKLLQGGHPDRHTALLCAIKPYLGRERQEAAEQMIRLCRIWTALQGVGGSLTPPRKEG